MIQLGICFSDGYLDRFARVKFDFCGYRRWLHYSAGKQPGIPTTAGDDRDIEAPYPPEPQAAPSVWRKVFHIGQEPNIQPVQKAIKYLIC